MDSKGKTVLFLSNGSLFCEFARECFKQDGHEFFDFSLWEECKDQMSDLSPDIVLVDLDNYPFEELPKIRTNVCIVGFYSDDQADQLESLSFSGYIKKPITPEDVVSKSLFYLES